MNIKLEDFPILKSSSNFEIQNHIEDEIVSLYFLLQRCKHYSENMSVYKKTKEVLDFLKKHAQLLKKNLCYNRYVDLLFRMIPQTRDVIYGKGEHTMSYMLVFAFYDFEPSLSIFALHRFVSPIVPQSHYFGSWRDIQYFCQFVKEYSKEKEDHPLIAYAVELMNTQLYSDVQTYKFSINCFSKNHISNVAKWIPRERNNQFAWLHNKLARQWIKIYKPYIFDNVHSLLQYKRAMNKSKKIYRKQYSFLNKQLQTTEILLTQKKYHAIQPENINLQTFVHENHLFDSSECQEKQECIDKIKNHFENSFQKNENFIYKHDFRNVNHISLCYIVKLAFTALHHEHQEILSFIDKLWKKINILIPHYEKGFFIPVVDISLQSKKDNSESFYFSLGLAITLSENSNITNRIVAMDRKPLWIDCSDNMTFTQKIRHFIEETKNGQNTEANYFDVIEFIFHGLNNSNASNYFIKNINVVFFSSFSSQKINTSFFNQYESMNQLYDKVPRITFWNTSVNGINNFYMHFHQCKYLYMSGFSTSVLKQFIKINKKCINKPRNAFEFIEQMCQSSYYDCFSHYLQLYL